MCPFLGAPSRAAWEAECDSRKADLRTQAGVSQFPVPEELDQRALFHTGAGRPAGLGHGMSPPKSQSLDAAERLDGSDPTSQAPGPAQLQSPNCAPAQDAGGVGGQRVSPGGGAAPIGGRVQGKITWCPLPRPGVWAASALGLLRRWALTFTLTILSSLPSQVC